MKRQTISTAAILSLAWIWNAPAAAKEFQSHVELDAVVKQALDQNIGAVGGARTPVDRRLKLEKCPESPTVDVRTRSVATIICPPLGWRLSVPLVTFDRVQKRENAAQHIIARGQPVLLVVRRNGFVISRQMIADRKGRLGEVIPVRRTRRSAPILAEITGAGRVSVPQL